MMKRLFFPLLLISVLVIGVAGYLIFRSYYTAKIDRVVAEYSGSESCRPCHERFYDLWANSYHGLAMQPVTKEFIDSEIKEFDKKIRVGTSDFNVFRREDSLFFSETKLGGEFEEFSAVHVMGGKYVYYFLASLEKGRLQVLPLAYDCKTDSWYNNPESGVRHFETLEEDAPVNWMNYLYTFNTTCYSCHVSQLNTNFIIETLEYNTSWSEPGINCETCHGPGYDHIRACVEAGEGNVPQDIKLVVTSLFSADQHDSSCGSCHAKSNILIPGFPPGGRFYDYFNLITLENHDFYADGRDLGENYTMTTWAMNSCKASAGIHCVTCHTSSGRYRFAGEDPNNACMPCHNDKVDNVPAHTFHVPDSPGSNCIDCHMPKTSFARMDRSDHSFRPPMPEATIAFGSPNACNICHDDQTAEWANEWIKKTHKVDYQSETIEAGMLIRSAREGDWGALDRITQGIIENRFNEVFTTSFIRLMENCDDDRKWPAIFAGTLHSSPLIRAASAHALSDNHSRKTFDLLVKLAQDDLRVVRLSSAYSLSFFPAQFINETNSTIIAETMAEYEQSLIARPDDWASHYNLGNYYSNRGNYNSALNSYSTSINLYPEAILSLVNAGFTYSLIGNYKESETMFLQALSFSPDNEATLLNLALLYGERGETGTAIDYFRRLLKVSENSAVAAYNLSVLIYEKDQEESLSLSRSAMIWEPDNLKYKYTYAYFLNQSGYPDDAESHLVKLLESDSTYIDAYYLLTNILAEKGKVDR